MIKIFVSSVCILTITLGVSRFGFTPILPIMQAEAGLGVAEGGWVTSAHYLGYLVGVISFLYFSNHETKRAIFNVWFVK